MVAKIEKQKAAVLEQIELKIQECGESLNDLVEEQIDHLNESTEALRHQLRELVSNIYLNKNKEEIYLTALRAHSFGFLQEIQDTCKRYSDLVKANKEAIKNYFKKIHFEIDPKTQVEAGRLFIPNDSIKEEFEKVNKINDTVMTLGKPNDFQQNFFSNHFGESEEREPKKQLEESFH